MFMTIILILSFVMTAITAGYLLKEDLSDMLPFVWCGLCLTLYMLAFANGLSFINYILPACAVGLTAAVLFGIRKRADGGAALRGYLRDRVITVPVLTYLLLTVIIVICISGRIAVWWDDINFWMPDVKSLYYMNGFASKYANVSPSFGDYPPGVQMARWFTAHLCPSGYNEGAVYIGYYLFNLSFLLPVYKSAGKKNMWLVLPLAVISWLLPGVADKYGYGGSCMDLSMAFIFGGILISAFDTEHESRHFDNARIMLYLAMLVLTKSTGAMWALFGLIIWIVVRSLNVTSVTKHNILRYIGITMAPLAAGLSWLLFCLLHRRVTNTTTTMVAYATTDKYGISENTAKFAQAFIKAFLTEPLHVDHTWIYLPPIAMLVLIIAGMIFLYKKDYLPGREGKFTAIALPVIGAAYYVLIFCAHITIFATEDQYLEANAMAASIERYGVPFMFGSIIFLLWAYLRKSKEHTVRDVLILLVVICLFTDMPAAYNGLIGYRETKADDLETRQSFMDEENIRFADTAAETFPDGNVRICRLRDGSYTRVADAYVAYEVSPVSVISISYDLDVIDESWLVNSVSQTHASYLYVDTQDADGDTYAFLKDCVSGEDFEYETLYRIAFEDGTMVLYPLG